MALDPAWIALIATICGGVGLKVVEHWLGRNKVKVDDAARIRDELRIEITSQKEEIKTLEAEANTWRERYYALLEKHMTLQTELAWAIRGIKMEQQTEEVPPLTGKEGS